MAAKLTLISHKLCPYVQRAVIALNEKGVGFERVDIDLANKPDWFLKLSPLGKVPVKLKVDLGTEFRVVIVKVFGCCHDKSSVVHARDARRPCDSEGEILGPCRENPIGRCECKGIISH